MCEFYPLTTLTACKLRHENAIITERTGAQVDHRLKCYISKVYIASEFENLQMRKVKQWAKEERKSKSTRVFLRSMVNWTFQKDSNYSRNQIIRFITSPEIISANKAWLKRVQQRMTSDVDGYNDIDLKYLSRFNVTRQCGAHIDNWFEWIEPLTIESRHPFSFFDVMLTHGGINRENSSSSILKMLKPDAPVHLQSVDHILIQNRKNLNKHQPRSKQSVYILDAGNIFINFFMKIHKVNLLLF